MNNKKTGTRFEYEVADMLRKSGWWTHVLTQSAGGQPADLIAVRDNRAVLVDCKVCSNNKFPLDRIEPNQESAFRLWQDACNCHYLLVLKLKDGTVRALDMRPVLSLRQEVQVLTEDMILQFGVRLDRALNKVRWKGVTT